MTKMTRGIRAINRKLTLRQKGFIEDVIKTKNPTEAARRNYNLGSKGGSKTKKALDYTANAIATENLRKPLIVRELEKVGLTRKFLSEELSENMRLSKESEDYRAHLKGIELGMKAFGDLREKDAKVNIGVVVGYINTGEVKKLEDDKYKVIEGEKG